MSGAIDLLKFQQSSGELRWLPVVAAAFLRQLPEWRLEFAAALAAHDLGQQADLLHKMRGSCYAVAALRAAQEIALAEAALARGQQLAPRQLLDRLELAEAELRLIVASAPAK
ncbi:MAG: hypothetical protein H7273_00685 [Polaromonas sp.]|nr:hypothetical protein [Polaromonas sp.]